jgi:hypothetical protein
MMTPKKKYAIAAVAVISIIAAFWILKPGGDVVYGPNISISEANRIVRDKYPDTGETTYEENCEVCNQTSCRKLDKPCWKTNATVNRTGVSIAIDTTSGDFLGADESCIWWQCNPVYCRLSFSDENATYYNYDCDNPVPKCDEELEICRPCLTDHDCLRRRTYQTLQENRLVGSEAFGYYDTTSGKCIIMERYIDMTTLDQCELSTLRYVKCIDGTCVNA